MCHFNFKNFHKGSQSRTKNLFTKVLKYYVLLVEINRTLRHPVVKPDPSQSTEKTGTDSSQDVIVNERRNTTNSIFGTVIVVDTVGYFPVPRPNKK